ncbi:MAG: tripartite tricarboxylate transporter substrate binding protein [Microbacteriaceae bacterium]|nr:tripartite tricarboxylate transporter substrate binding protein [Burkholderiaceae bacterium]
MHSDRQPSRRQFLVPLLAGLGAAGLPGLAGAQTFPSRPIRIVVPFSPGGPTDLMARAIGRAMSEGLGQPVLVDNKPGGGGVIGLGEVTKNPADGHTLVFPSILAVTNPALMPNYPFDTLRDFAPVTVVGYIPHALVVRPDFAARTLADLVEMAKQKPDSLSYGSSGNGTSAHLAGAMFAERAGFRALHVPYRGAGPAVQDLLGGQIQFMFLDMSSALGQIKAGKLRALAIAPARRFSGLPDVPTIAEQGYEGFNIRAWYGLLVRAGTPDAVLQRLYAETRRALESTEVRDTFRLQGIGPGGTPPAESGVLIRDDLAQWKRTIERLKITQQ